MDYPKITVVTTNFNLGNFLEETICSVLDQGYPNLEYIIIDAGSTDKSLEIIQKYENKLAWWVSEPDQGQYHGIQKGFDKSTGEIMCWLNSDDKFHHKSLFAMAEIMLTFPEVKWVQGLPTEYAASGFGINRVTLPWARWSRLRYLCYDFQFIQQEATFWRRELWEKAGGKLGLEFGLAADTELWARFFRYEKLYTTLTLIGGFRYRWENQRSKSNFDAYFAECGAIIKRERARLSAFKRFGLDMFRLLTFPFGLLYFFDVPGLQWFYEKMFGLPPVIKFDFDQEKFVFSKRTVRHPPLFMFGQQIYLKKLLGKK